MCPVTILDHVRDLLGQGASPLAGIEPAEVISVFRDSFFEIRRARRVAYVQEVVRQHFLSRRELAKVLGYKSGGSIDAAMAGKIDDNRFEFLRATVAKQVRCAVRWPPLSEFATLALLRTMTQLGGRLGLSAEPFDWEEYEVLRRVLRPEWLLTAAQEPPASVQSALRAMLREVQAFCGTSRMQRPADIDAALTRWGRLYLFCKSAIPGLCGQGGEP